MTAINKSSFLVKNFCRFRMVLNVNYFLYLHVVLVVFICTKQVATMSNPQEKGEQLDGACYQVVPYMANHDSSNILPMFNQEQRTFQFADKEWIIKQQWDEIGVASVVWESAILLCQYLTLLDPGVLSGARVIELGSGTGLVGLVASALGAESVVLTDKDTRPAAFNLELNRHNLQGKNVSVSELMWGEDVSNFHPPFDLILAADVIYIEDVFAGLIKTLVDLSDFKSVVFLACKRRYERHDHFFQKLSDTEKFVDEIVWTWPEREEVKVHKLTRHQ